MWKCFFLFAKADEEQHVVSWGMWGMPGYNAPDEVCPECLANRDQRPFTDLSPGARWRATDRMHFARCGCDVCDESQDDGRTTISEANVQRITSRKTAQT